MKKHDLFKILGISFLVTILLSWIIPAGVYGSGAFASLDKTAPIGLFDAFKIPVMTIATFVQYGILFLVIGGFYGVLNKTGAYSKLVEKVVIKWSDKKRTFLIITIACLALLSSLTALPALLFVLVPFFVTILLSLGYNKITTLAATVGAILIGQIGCVLGFNLIGYLAVFFKFEMNKLLVFRTIIFIITSVLFIMMVLKNSNKVEKIETLSTCSKCKEKLTSKDKFCPSCGEKVKEIKKETKKENIKESKKDETDKISIPLYNTSETKKSIVPLVAILSILFVLLILGSYNWYYAFEFAGFNTFHEKVLSINLGSYPFMSNLLGTVSELGFWGNYDIAAMLVIASLLIGWIYNVKFNEIIDGFKKGMKEIAPTAFYAMFASIVFTAILNLTSGNFVATIIDKLASTEGFNFFSTTLSAIVGSLFYNDFYTLSSTYYPAFAGVNANLLPALSLILQSMFSLLMVILPTSIFLVAGLKYLDISYKKWIKYIWKFVVIIFAVLLIITFIITMI